MPGTKGVKPLILIILTFFTLMLGGCATEGDLGRPKYDYWSRTARGVLEEARITAAMREDPDLPLTAAEDALRERLRDLNMLAHQGVVTDGALSRRGDGFARVQGLTEDINVEHHKFRDFVRAAQKVMTIDEAREERLYRLTTLDARRQHRAVKARRRENNTVIREGVRQMRRRVMRIRRFKDRVLLEAPGVPMRQCEDAFERLSQAVVAFHAEIDQRAHMRLGMSAGGGTTYKN